MESLLSVIEETIQSYLKSQIYQTALMSTKAIAIGFFLIEFLNNYLENLNHFSKGGFQPKDFIKPLFYMFLICFFNSIVSFFEVLIGEFFKSIENGKPMYQSLIQAQKNLDEMGNTQKLSLLNILPRTLTMLFFGIFAKLACWAVGIIDIIIYSVFIAQRYFLLGLANLLFPFLLAFSALNWFKDYIKKGFKAYFALLISISVIHLGMNVGQKLFENIKNLLSGTKEMIGEQVFSNFSLGDSFSILIAGMIALVLKIKIIKTGIQFITNLLT